MWQDLLDWCVSRHREALYHGDCNFRFFGHVIDCFKDGLDVPPAAGFHKIFRLAACNISVMTQLLECKEYTSISNGMNFIMYRFTASEVQRIYKHLYWNEFRHVPFHLPVIASGDYVTCIPWISEYGINGSPMA